MSMALLSVLPGRSPESGPVKYCGSPASSSSTDAG